MPSITHQQARALEALNWLFSNRAVDRGTGRTRVLALAFLRQACNHPRVWFHVVDNEPDGIRSVLDNIQRIMVDSGDGTILLVDRSQRRFQLQRAPAAEARHYIFEGFVEEGGVRRVEVLERARVAVELARQQLGLNASDQDVENLAVDLMAGPPTSTTDEARAFFWDNVHTGAAIGKQTLTTRDLVTAQVTDRPGYTATQIAHTILRPPANVASVCSRMVKEGLLRREPNARPKGGWQYFPVVQMDPATIPTSWDRILRDDEP